MTSRPQLENIILIAVTLGQLRQNIRPIELAKRIGKLQKLSVSLRKRYENECLFSFAKTPEHHRQTDALETRAKELAAELRAPITLRSDYMRPVLVLTLGDKFFELF